MHLAALFCFVFQIEETEQGDEEKFFYGAAPQSRQKQDETAAMSECHPTSTN
jgi:hypothetical protein